MNNIKLLILALCTIVFTNVRAQKLSFINNVDSIPVKIEIASDCELGTKVRLTEMGINNVIDAIERGYSSVMSTKTSQQHSESKFHATLKITKIGQTGETDTRFYLYEQGNKEPIFSRFFDGEKESSDFSAASFQNFETIGQKLAKKLKSNGVNINNLVLVKQSYKIVSKTIEYTEPKCTLTKVEKPNDASNRFGEVKELTQNDKELFDFGYADDIISIVISCDGTNSYFVLKNISSNTIKIEWDEAVFVDIDGNTSKVIHNGVKFSEKNDNHPATTIIRNAKTEDVITPTSVIGSGPEYEIHPYKYDKNMSGSQISIMLPIKVKDVINEYIFTFDVNVEVKQKTEEKKVYNFSI